LIFSAEAAGAIRERTWHPSQDLVELPGGQVKVTLQIAAPEELERWLLGFAADVQVAEPASLAERLRARHAAAAAPASPIWTAPARPPAGRAGPPLPSRDNDRARHEERLPTRRRERRSTRPSDR
jgi:hypothetical protein